MPARRRLGAPAPRRAGGEEPRRSRLLRRHPVEEDLAEQLAIVEEPSPLEPVDDPGIEGLLRRGGEQTALLPGVERLPQPIQELLRAGAELLHRIAAGPPVRLHEVVPEELQIE